LFCAVSLSGAARRNHVKIPLKMTRLRTHSLISGILLVLICILAGTRANAQVNDLINAAGKGDLARVKALLDAKADVNAKDTDGGTALTYASQNGHLEVVQALLANGANVNAKMIDDETALIDASENGHFEVVKALLAKGAEVNAKMPNGGTALMIASQGGYREVVQALLDAGADVNAKDIDGVTALMRASRNGQLEVVKALLAKGADVNAKTDNGVTALKAATAGGHAEIRALLSQASLALGASKSDKGQEFTRIYQHTYDEVFQASQKAIERMGYFVTAQDKDKGTISGNGIFYTKTSVGIKGRKCTFDIHIETLNAKPETRVTINANVEVWGASASSRLKERFSNELQNVLATYR
jgi:ankyrin repeat protein